MILSTPYFRLILIKLSCLLALVCLISGCQSIDVRGQFVTDNAIDEINSKKPTQEEIVNLIGSPTYVPDYSPNNWYYIQRSMARRAWFEAKVIEQRIVKIAFNNHGRAIEAKLISNIHQEDVRIESSYTKSVGTEKTNIQKFVKNIGRFNKTTDGKKRQKKSK